MISESQYEIILLTFTTFELYILKYKRGTLKKFLNVKSIQKVVKNSLNFNKKTAFDLFLHFLTFTKEDYLSNKIQN